MKNIEPQTNTIQVNKSFQIRQTLSVKSKSAFVYTTPLARINKHSCTYIKVGREGNKHCVWDPFPLINLLPSHPFDTRISTFWTYIKCTTHN